MSCLLWEDEHYEDGQEIGKRIAELCRQVESDELARVAIQAKQDMKLRHTPLLLAAKAKGARIMTGRELAICQALDAFELFTGFAPQASVMGEAFDRVMAARRDSSYSG